jgi:hypothetical protein
MTATLIVCLAGWASISVVASLLFARLFAQQEQHDARMYAEIEMLLRHLAAYHGRPTAAHIAGLEQSAARTEGRRAMEQQLREALRDLDPDDDRYDDGNMIPVGIA